MHPTGIISVISKELLTGNINSIKGIFRSVILFLDEIMKKIEFHHELKSVWETRAERLENECKDIAWLEDIQSIC